MTRYAQRVDFILLYLKNALGGCDVLNVDFVNEYVIATKAGVHLMPYGAHKCPQLGRDLRKMFREGKLARKRVGVQGFAGMSFPNWVYSYEISPRYREIADLRIERAAAIQS